MRYVILGAGAIGGTIGGRLAQHGHDVLLIARGAHAQTLADKGLHLATPDGPVVQQIPVADGVDSYEPTPDDVVIIATKTQDTADALAAIAPRAGDIPICCAQNGVENERIALRLFPRVYGIYVLLPGTHLEPGIVAAPGAPYSGILDIGRFPSGLDEIATHVAETLDTSGFRSIARDEIMPWKYAKLLGNLGNAVNALAGSADDVVRRARAEGAACLAAAGIEFCSGEETAQRRDHLVDQGQIEGMPRSGSSSWQSLARGTGTIEADYLNGEIALLGRQFGVPTPVNSALQRLAVTAAAERRPPGSMSADELGAAVDAGQDPIR